MVLEGLSGFDWDVHNVGHVDRHGVAPAEVEEAVGRPHFIISAAAVGDERRWKLLGKSAAGRYLVVVFTIRDGLFRTVTAHTMNRKERNIYGPHIDSTK